MNSEEMAQCLKTTWFDWISDVTASRVGSTYYEFINLDGHVKSQKLPLYVIPAKAGIQYFQ